MICSCIATLIYCKKQILKVELSIVIILHGVLLYWARFCKILLYMHIRWVDSLNSRFWSRSVWWWYGQYKERGPWIKVVPPWNSTRSFRVTNGQPCPRVGGTQSSWTDAIFQSLTCCVWPRIQKGHAEEDVKPKWAAKGSCCWWNWNFW